MISLRHATAALAFVTLASARPAHADDITKEACLDAHAKGQDAREQGKLSLARKLFMTCAQSSCPALVQNDCARFSDDLLRMQSSITFAARDAGGADLPDTTVYVDNVLVTTHLDDGKPHDVDPGKHVVRFVHNSEEQEVTVVVGTGEKGRTVSATYGGGGKSSGPARPRPTSHVTHAGGSKVMIVAGGIVAAAGIGLATYGFTSVPAGCSIGTHTCGAPPGDPIFDKASSAMRSADLGMAAAGAGIALVVGGYVWYRQSAVTVKEKNVVAAPWVTPTGAGLALTGRL